MTQINKNSESFFDTLSRDFTTPAIVFNVEKITLLMPLFPNNVIGDPPIVIGPENIPLNIIQLSLINMYDGTEEINLKDFYDNKINVDFSNALMISRGKSTLDFNHINPDKPINEIFMEDISKFLNIIYYNLEYNVAFLSSIQELTEEQQEIFNTIKTAYQNLTIVDLN